MANQHKKDLVATSAKLKAADTKVVELEAELDKVRAELVEAKAEKEDVIDDYMKSEEFEKLMEEHDKVVYPAHFTVGWNEAKKAILEKHPGLYDPQVDFVSPERPLELERLLEMGEEGIKEDGLRKEVAEEEEETDDSSEADPRDKASFLAPDEASGSPSSKKADDTDTTASS